MDTEWSEDVAGVKKESNLNFNAGSALSEDEDFYSKKKISRDPLSHRIIEKRRRDRMNNCLADLSRLIPSGYMKKGRGRVEKTEIIEMAIRHMKHLQAHPCTEGSRCPLADDREAEPAHAYQVGFNECLSETIHFLIEVEGFFSTSSLCLRLTSHLHNHIDNILKGKALEAQLNASQPKRRCLDEDLSDLKRHEGIEEVGQQYTGYREPVLHNLDNGQCSQPCGQCSQQCSQQCRYPLYPPDVPPRPLASPPQQLSPPLSCPSERGDSSSGSYKFKDNIRKRFCREGAAGSSVHVRPVPVFALSPNNSYYYPLTVELPVPPEEPVPPSDPVLHPVTISVNFNQNQRQPM